MSPVQHVASSEFSPSKKISQERSDSSRILDNLSDVPEDIFSDSESETSPE
jgi:hypothetical protein